MNVNRTAGRVARKFAVLTAALAISVTALAACSGGSSSETDGEPTLLTMSSPFDVTNWDPAVGGDDFSTLFHEAVYSPLLNLNADLSVSENIATAWEYDETSTALTLTLTPDLTFSDGTALDAEAVKANLERSRDANGPLTAALSGIESISVESPTELTLNLAAPDLGLLFNLARGPGMMVSPAAFETAKVTPVGYGPYLLDQDASKPGTEYVFEPNPDYSLPVEFGFDKVVFKVLDFGALVGAVSSGQIDVAGIFPDTLQAVTDAGIETSPVSGFISGLWLVDRGGEVNPAIGDVRVRQALNYAVDAETLLETLEGGAGFRSTQMFAKGTPAWDEALNDSYPYDPEKAKELLAEAGYPDGFTLVIPAAGSLPIYPVLQDQLSNVGVTVEYATVAENQIFEAANSGDYAVNIGGWFGPSDNWFDATNLLMPAGPFNPFHTDDPKVAELMGEIAVAEEADRAALFQELNAYIVDQAWFAPWYIGESYVAYNGDNVKTLLKGGESIVQLSDFQPAQG